MYILPPNLASLANAAGAATGIAGGTFRLSSVRLKCGSESFVAEATDGKISVRVEGEYQHCDNVGPCAGKSDTSKEAVIPAVRWKKVFTDAASRKVPAKYRVVPVLLKEDSVEFTCLSSDASGTTTVLKDPGPFPDLDGVAPKSPPAFTANVSAENLLRVLKIAVSVLGKGAQLTLEFFADDNPKQAFLAKISAASDSQKFVSLISTNTSR